MNVLAASQEGNLGGGAGRESSPSSSGDSGSSMECTGSNIYKYKSNPSTLVKGDCTGYSWMFFKAIGPAGEGMLFRPDDTQNMVSVEDPIIDGSCMNPGDGDGGFWHFGKNAFTANGAPGLYYSEANRGLKTNKDNNGAYAFWFSCKSTVTTYYGTACYNIGHISTLNYKTSYKEIYEGDQYSSLFDKKRWREGNAVVYGQSLDLLNQGWGDGGVGKRMDNDMDRGQRLYKKINGVWVPMYIAVGTKQSKDIYGEFIDAWKIKFDFDKYPGSWCDGKGYCVAYNEAKNTEGLTLTDTLPSWYYFCHSSADIWDLELIPVDEEVGEDNYSEIDLFDLSWDDAKWSDMAYDNSMAFVRYGTNPQYYFVGFKTEDPNGGYISITNTDPAQNSYIDGRTLTIQSIGADQTVYAVYRKVSLIAKAVDENGNLLDGEDGRNKIDDVVSTDATPNGHASVTRRVDDRYIFRGWASSIEDAKNGRYITTTNGDQYVSGNENETFHIGSLANQTIVYAVYEEKSSFLGQIQLFEGATTKASVGYSDEDIPTVTYNLESCDPISGCNVTFKHNLKRYSGNKTVAYRITRDSNYYISGQNRGIESKTLVPNGNNNGTEDEDFSGVANGNTKQVYSDGELTLVPGQVVCETLSFKPYVWKDDSATLKLCASALGNAQPDDPTDPGNPDTTGTPWNDPDGDDDYDRLTGASAFLKIEVKNEKVTRYGTYRKIVYAKPGDTVKYRATYNPVLQYTAYLKPQQMRIDGGSNIYPSLSKINTDSYLKDLFNTNKGSSLKNWNNAFYVYSEKVLLAIMHLIIRIAVTVNVSMRLAYLRSGVKYQIV
ncbi:hypothetical protein J5868_00475 [Candidatus Saccharibacteria bacterium]|nr:hypothetical protein [Candidatus Saccharibacteria bacterium]